MPRLESVFAVDQRDLPHGVRPFPSPATPTTPTTPMPLCRCRVRDMRPCTNVHITFMLPLFPACLHNTSPQVTHPLRCLQIYCVPRRSSTYCVPRRPRRPRCCIRLLLPHSLRQASQADFPTGAPKFVGIAAVWALAWCCPESPSRAPSVGVSAHSLTRRCATSMSGVPLMR